jgi:hypothetical protein
MLFAQHSLLREDRPLGARCSGRPSRLSSALYLKLQRLLLVRADCGQTKVSATNYRPGGMCREMLHVRVLPAGASPPVSPTFERAGAGSSLSR